MGDSGKPKNLAINGEHRFQIVRPNLKVAIEDIVSLEERGRDDAKRQVEEKIVEAAKSQYGKDFDIRAKIDKLGNLHLVQVLKVVKDVENEFREVSLKNARLEFPNIKEGAELTNVLEYNGFQTPFGNLSTLKVQVKSFQIKAHGRA